MLLIIPVEGYLEAEGPMPVRDVEWVELALAEVWGGRRGIPLEIRDISDTILPAVRELQVSWELRETTLSTSIVENEPIRAVHLPNPFFTPKR